MTDLASHLAAACGERARRDVPLASLSTITGLVRWTISHALGGIEAWAGTPGTVGGAPSTATRTLGRLKARISNAG